MLKKIITTMLIVSILPINVFAASPQTKQMIHDTLSKFCIPPKKENCNPREEGQYDPNYDFCLCENDGMVYSKSERKCVNCEPGTYYKKDMKDNSCKNCPEGQFQPNSGQSECKECNSNACYEVGNSRTSCDYKCGGGRPYCNGYGSCVECTNDSHCSGSYRCSGNSCVCNISCLCGVDYSDCSCNSCPNPEPDTGDDDGNTGNSEGGSCNNKKCRRCMGVAWITGPFMGLCQLLND